MQAGTWNELVVARWSGSSAPVVVDDDVTWSGDELLARAGGASTWLDGLGFPVGAPVPALVDESAAAIALTVGAALSGRPLARSALASPPRRSASPCRTSVPERCWPSRRRSPSVPKRPPTPASMCR